jgi:hypothetical protein
MQATGSSATNLPRKWPLLVYAAVVVILLAAVCQKSSGVATVETTSNPAVAKSLLGGLANSTQRVAFAVHSFQNYTTEIARHMQQYSSALDAAGSQLLTNAKTDQVASQSGLLKPLIEEVYDKLHNLSVRSQQLTRDTLSVQMKMRNHMVEVADTVDLARHKLVLHLASSPSKGILAIRCDRQVVLTQYVSEPLMAYGKILNSSEGPFAAIKSLANEIAVLEADMGSVISKVKRLVPEMQGERVAVKHADKGHGRVVDKIRQDGKLVAVNARSWSFKTSTMDGLVGSLSMVQQVLQHSIAQSRQILMDLDSLRLVLLKVADLASLGHYDLCVQALELLECEMREAAAVIALPFAYELSELPAAGLPAA